MQRIIGRGDFALLDADGNILRKKKNLIVNQGFGVLAQNLNPSNVASQYINGMIFGSGTTTPLATDTALVNPLPTPNTASITSVTTGGVGVRIYRSNIGPGVATGSISEAGLLSGTTLLARVTFDAMQKAASASFSAQWTWTFIAGT